MGMTASQARFSGLIAKMNNIEIESQQIIRQDNALSNKFASYHGSLSGICVPTAASVEQNACKSALYQGITVCCAA